MPHWTQSEDGACVSRAMSHVFKAMITPEEEGGLKTWIDSNCSVFKAFEEDGEQRLVFMELFSEFEKLLATLLDAFAHSEGEDWSVLARRIEAVVQSDNKMATKGALRLLNGLEYKKFCVIMKNAYAKGIGQTAKEMETGAGVTMVEVEAGTGGYPMPKPNTYTNTDTKTSINTKKDSGQAKFTDAADEKETYASIRPPSPSHKAGCKDNDDAEIEVNRGDDKQSQSQSKPKRAWN